MLQSQKASDHSLDSTQAPTRAATCPAGVDWSAVDSKTFWSIADQIQANTLCDANALFAYVEHADLTTLRSILIQYRYFTVYYISDLSLLVARLENGPLRSYHADILSDELGHGNSAHAHPTLYDNFMCSLGSTAQDLSTSALRNNIRLLDETRRMLVDPRHRQAGCRSPSSSYASLSRSCARYERRPPPPSREA